MSTTTTEFREFVSTVEKSAPRCNEPEAKYALRVMAGWRFHCGRAGKDPTLPKVGQRPGETLAEAEEAESFREQAAAMAEAARTYAQGTPVQDLAEAWLAYKGRAADGREMP